MPSLRRRIPPDQRRLYERSDATSFIRLQPSVRLRASVAALPEALAGADVPAVQMLAQAIVDEIAAHLRVSRARVVVHGTRPSDRRGELHGLYTAGPGRPATIEVWMRTAKRGQVVAFKTFLRTLLHELCHHLDYTLLSLGDSVHSDGFYKRESSLFHQIGAGAIVAPRPSPTT